MKQPTMANSDIIGFTCDGVSYRVGLDYMTGMEYGENLTFGDNGGIFVSWSGGETQLFNLRYVSDIRMSDN